MKIKWLGHSCFLITSEAGVRILIDPFDPKVGYPTPAVAAEIVTTSHQHSDHNYTQAVPGEFKLIDAPGHYHLGEIEIMGVPTYHDAAGGSQRGSNIVFRYTVDGLNIVHCGDLGHALTREQVRTLTPVDILLVPVGGHYTIDAETAFHVAHQLKAAMTIPMHYRTPRLDFPITPVEPFLQAAGGGRMAGSAEIEVTRASLDGQAGVVVLDYPD